MIKRHLYKQELDFQKITIMGYICLHSSAKLCTWDREPISLKEIHVQQSRSTTEKYKNGGPDSKKQQ